MSPSILIGKTVGIELIRRKDLYVMGLLVIVFSIGTLGARVAGIEEGPTGTFLLNLGLSMSYIFAHVLTLLLSTRQLPAEFENRTIYPILSRPVTRFQFLTGKWMACGISGFSAYLIFFAMVWLTNPHLEPYSFGLLIQTLLLQLVSLLLVSGISILCSLLMPKGLALVLAGGMVFAGSMLSGLLISAFDQSSLAGLIRWGVYYVPDFHKLNLTTRLTDGIGPLSLTLFTGLIVYGTVHIIFALVVSRWCFERRVL